jgi:hypothetical protein
MTLSVSGPNRFDDRMSIEYGGMKLAKETEVHRENLYQCHFVHHNSHLTWDETRDAAVGRMSRSMIPVSLHELTS